MLKANLVMIGGTIAAGKTSLVTKLAQHLNWIQVPEVTHSKLQELLWQQQYEHAPLDNMVIEYYYLKNRANKYQAYAQSAQTAIFDRSIFESIIFTTLLMAQATPKSFLAFKSLWKTMIQELLAKYGRPHVYIYLKVNWETFKQRIYRRNRQVEINNFESNQAYFRALLQYYQEEFPTLVQQFAIPLITIETDTLNEQEVFATALVELKSLNLISN